MDYFIGHLYWIRIYVLGEHKVYVKYVSQISIKIYYVQLVEIRFISFKLYEV